MTTNNVVFLFDVDNTLLDNDRVTEDLKRFLERELGKERQEQYWRFFEELRADLGYADYLGALQRYRVAYPRDPKILKASLFLVNYHFANRLYPNSLDVVEKAQQSGTAVILSDGDAVFQPRKIERSGLLDAVNSNILIYIHKELELEDVEKKYPADHYIVIDDKLRILDAIKKVWQNKVTTVFPKQGHYARDPKALASYAPADLSVERIGDLLDCDFSKFI
jgi:FMN phosphatase YigB (HAD superfamily)